MRWAGDFHPVSNFTTHPGLGGIVPSSLLAERRVIVVRPEGFTVAVGSVPAWDFPALEREPEAGDDSVTIELQTTPRASRVTGVCERARRERDVWGGGGDRGIPRDVHGGRWRRAVAVDGADGDGVANRLGVGGQSPSCRSVLSSGPSLRTW